MTSFQFFLQAWTTSSHHELTLSRSDLNRPGFPGPIGSSKRLTFKLDRRDVADMAVVASWVVERFDVIKHIGACLVAGRRRFLLDSLAFEQLKMPDVKSCLQNY